MCRFVIDDMLGSLARWLRLMGCETHYYNHALDDTELIAEARRLGAVLVTRDEALSRRRAARTEVTTLLLRSNDLEEQISELADKLGGLPAGPVPRCPECGGTLEKSTGNKALRRVPPYVRRTHKRILTCEDCGRTFWPGSHWPKIVSRIGGLRRGSNVVTAGRK